jgi:GTP-binding protein
MSVPVVAVVGRPNVGKSTLLNRIVGRREAIVEERPGVTRDRKAVDADWNGRSFVVMDTGGFIATEEGLDAEVSRQSVRAIEDADVVVLVVDVTNGVTTEDEQVAALLRGRDIPVFVVANKVDDTGREADIWDFLALGLGEPHPISALHGRRTGDFLDELVAALPEEEDEGDGTEDREEILSVAIVGRPNVGKSTLFNKLDRAERSVVHDMAGTTRDTIDTVIESPSGPVRILDTAGMRRRGKIDQSTEYYSVVRALKAIDEADVVLLVIDALIGVTHQDQRLAERASISGSPVVVLLNKWEVADAERREDVTEQVADRLKFLPNAKVLKISALTGKGTHKILEALLETADTYHRRIPTAKVNDVLRQAQAHQPAPGGTRVLYATQGATDPPTFTLFANRRLPPTYLRYLERKLREAFDLGDAPLKLRVRARRE